MFTKGQSNRDTNPQVPRQEQHARQLHLLPPVSCRKGPNPTARWALTSCQTYLTTKTSLEKCLLPRTGQFGVNGSHTCTAGASQHMVSLQQRGRHKLRTTWLEQVKARLPGSQQCFPWTRHTLDHCPSTWEQHRRSQWDTQHTDLRPQNIRCPHSNRLLRVCLLERRGVLLLAKKKSTCLW